MAKGNWGTIYGFITVILLIVIGFSVLYEPEQRSIVYMDTEITPSTDWCMYRFNYTHTGLAPSDCTVDAGLVLEWRTERLNHAEYTASKSSPAVYEDHIYIGLDTGALVSVNRLTGLVEWSFYTRGSRNGIHGSPCVDPERGQVYIGAYDGWLYALNLNNGRLIWENQLGDYIGSSPTLYKDTVYIGVEMAVPEGYLVGVNADTGQEVFRSDLLGSHPHSTPSIDPESGCVFLGENSGHLYCYWMANQSMRWSYEMKGDVKSTPAIYDGVVYITSWDRKLHAVEIDTGEAVWIFSTGASSMSSPTIDPDTGIVYFGNHGRVFYAVNATNGDEIWRYTTEDVIIASPTLVKSTNTVIIGSKDNGVYLFDAETGELKQKLELLSDFTGVPIAVGDHLYLFDHLGYLYSYVME